MEPTQITWYPGFTGPIAYGWVPNFRNTGSLYEWRRLDPITLKVDLRF